MEDVIRLAGTQRLADGVQVTEIALDVPHGFSDPRHLEERRLRVGRQRESVDRSAQLAQPEREPAALEARVSGEQDPLPAVRAYHVFQGAWPLFHASLSMPYSRAVSIGCQKPVWV